MEIGFPFMGDRLSLCRYSWAKRLTVLPLITTQDLTLEIMAI